MISDAKAVNKGTTIKHRTGEHLKLMAGCAALLPEFQRQRLDLLAYSANILTIGTQKCTIIERNFVNIVRSMKLSVAMAGLYTLANKF